MCKENKQRIDSKNTKKIIVNLKNEEHINKKTN